MMIKQKFSSSPLHISLIDYSKPISELVMLEFELVSHSVTMMWYRTILLISLIASSLCRASFSLLMLSMDNCNTLLHGPDQSSI